ncbi:MAG: carboxypeptidase-like regulatory domain-containing protein [Myxococcales bacterium]
MKKTLRIACLGLATLAWAACSSNGGTTGGSSTGSAASSGAHGSGSSGGTGSSGSGGSTAAGSSGSAGSTGASGASTSAAASSGGSSGATSGATTGGASSGATTGGSGSGSSTGSSTGGGCQSCVLGSAICAGSSVETCQANGSCTAYAQTATCSGGQICENGACVNQGCGNGCNTPPGNTCQDANTLLSYGADGGVCNNGACIYPSELSACPNGCSGGVCVPAAACSPGADRCNGSEVEQCNADGTAWLLVEACPTTCTGGLCDAPCAPGSSRCDGTNVDTCSDAGTAWELDTASCPNGCAGGACVQPDLVVDGQTVVMDGVYHYANGVVVKNGGEIQVGASGSLTLYAASIDVEISSSIVGTPGQQACAAPPDDVANGIRLVAPQVTVDGSITWTPASCAMDGVVIRADAIGGSGTVSAGSDRALLLYGTTGLAPSLQAPGATKSLMPPAAITSPTHPAGGTYNDDGPPASFSWDQPYSTVAGYYYTVGSSSAVPTATSTLDSAESLALPNPPAVGTTYLDVVTLDHSGNVGTVPHEFTLDIVDTPPTLSSTSNPTQGSYTTNNAVIIAWSGGNPGQGYYYLFDHYPDTRPTSATGTFEATTQSPPQVLLSGVAPGRWFFHMLAYDSMGYPTHIASNYEVDIGTPPSAGTLAGTVLDGTGQGIVGATVVVQRGLYSATTQAGGVYTFGNASIPAGSYEVVAEAPGTQWQQQTLAVTAGNTTDGDFTLTRGTGCPSCSDPCSGVDCETGGTPPPWFATCELGACFSLASLGGFCSQGLACESGVCSAAETCVVSCQSGLMNASQYYNCTSETQCCLGTNCVFDPSSTCATNQCCE